MFTMTGRGKRSVCASILLALVFGLVTPVYARTLRYDFGKKLSPWKRHRDCGGVFAGPWFINVEDGLVKIMDGGCGLDSMTGIYHVGDWTDYEVKVRIQARNLGPPGIRLFIRATPVWFFFTGNFYQIWRDDQLNIGEWSDIRLVAKDDKITYFIDGKKVGEEAAVGMSGGVAFIVEMSEFWLDYVEITGDDVWPVEPQGRLITCWAKLKRF